MDWLLLLGLVFSLIVGATAVFYLHAFVTRTREDFRETQPDLCITNLSAMSSGNVLTLFPMKIGGQVLRFNITRRRKALAPVSRRAAEVGSLSSTEAQVSSQSEGHDPQGVLTIVGEEATCLQFASGLKVATLEAIAAVFLPK